ncbi:MAG: tripartite tricarboxylate transporter TctB family protein [Pseudomonadota bacterium]
MSKKLNWDLVSAFFCLGMTIWIIYLTLTQFVIDKASGGGPFANSAFYPQVIAGVIIFLSLLLIFQSFTKRRRKEVSPSPLEGPVPIPDSSKEGQPIIETEKLPWGTSGVIVFVLILYTILQDLFGYVWVTPFFMAFLFWILNVRKPISIILLALASTYAMYFFFQELLDVILPTGRYSLMG